MSKTWQVQEAKARFGELLEASLKEGPQIVTKRGVEAAVLVPIDQWRRLGKRAEPTLKDLMLASGAKTESLTPRAIAIASERRGSLSRLRVSPRHQRRLGVAPP